MREDYPRWPDHERRSDLRFKIVSLQNLALTVAGDIPLESDAIAGLIWWRVRSQNIASCRMTKKRLAAYLLTSGTTGNCKFRRASRNPSPPEGVAMTVSLVPWSGPAGPDGMWWLWVICFGSVIYGYKFSLRRDEINRTLPTNLRALLLTILPSAFLYGAPAPPLPQGL